jgi:hypothetical protein
VAAFHFYPAIPERWSDLESLFGKNGANAGCWCMFWRLERAMFKKTKGEGNRQILKQIVEGDEQPGILAYDGTQAVGWCGIAPREKLVALENSRILKRVDDQPVVEAYPIDMQSPKLAGQTFNSYSGYMGVASAFRALGFEQVGQASETQLIMRLDLADNRRRK